MNPLPNWDVILLTIGFGLLFFGLSPLAQDEPYTDLSQTGCMAAMFGLFIVLLVTAIKVLT